MIYSKKYRIKFLCLFFSINLYAQEIWVEDNNSGEPLEGVAVFNQDKSRSTITDKYGKASLEIFSPNDSLNFQILGYENLKFKLFYIKYNKKQCHFYSFINKLVYFN